MFEIIVISFLFLLNGLFAMCEIALVSSRKSKLEQLAHAGSSGAKTALKLLDNPAKFLSTIQIGITLVGIIAGAYGGEAFTEDLQPMIEKITFLKPHAEWIAFTSIVIVITYFSLVIGELVPKSIAMANPEGITVRFAPFMHLLSILTYPFVIFLTISTKLLLKIFRIEQQKDSNVTEEELKYMIESSSRLGVIERQENEIMQSVFRFGDRNAESIMTHRSEIVWLDIHNSKDEIMLKVETSYCSKFPVCDGDLNAIIGTVSVRDIFLLANQSESFDLKSILKDALFIPVTMPALSVLDLFRKQAVHIGFVVDEYGEVEGLITLHDLVENIIGILPDSEEGEAEIIQREDGSWLIDGEIKIDLVKETLKIAELPAETNYHTLAGFMIQMFNKIPKSGDSFVYLTYKFEVVDMDDKRIDKVLVQEIK